MVRRQLSQIRKASKTMTVRLSRTSEVSTLRTMSMTCCASNIMPLMTLPTELLA